MTVEKSTPTITGTLTYTLNQTDGTARLSLALAKLASNSAAARNPLRRRRKTLRTRRPPRWISSPVI